MCGGPNRREMPRLGHACRRRTQTGPLDKPESASALPTPRHSPFWLSHPPPCGEGPVFFSTAPVIISFEEEPVFSYLRSGNESKVIKAEAGESWGHLEPKYEPARTVRHHAPVRHKGASELVIARVILTVKCS